MNRTVVIIIAIIIVVVIIYLGRNKIVKTVFNEKLSNNFTLGELMVTDQPFPNIPNEKEKANLKLLAVNVLQPIRDLLSMGKDKKTFVNSAFRSEDVNKAVGGVSTSQHRLGLAADIRFEAMSVKDAFPIIAKSNIPYDQLIIEKNAKGNMWIHVSYNPNGGRRQLLAANWDAAKGKMIYTPVTV